jgi:hypothetical protein
MATFALETGVARSGSNRQKPPRSYFSGVVVDQLGNGRSGPLEKNVVTGMADIPGLRFLVAQNVAGS